MNRLICYVSLVLSAFMIMGCESEISSPDEGTGTSVGTVVGFSLAGDYPVTKSAMSSLPSSSSRIVADLSEETGIDGLLLSEDVSSMDDAVSIVTKGTPVYTENYSDVYSGDLTPIGVFATTDWTDKTKDLAAAFKKQDGNSWTYEYSYDGWPDDNKLTYFFAAPSTLPNYIGTPSCLQTGKAIKFDLVSAKYPTNAVAQKDVLFTSKDIEVIRGENTTNDILFYHVFTAVKFKLGNTDDRFWIKKVELSGMYTSGTCTVTPNYPEDVTNSNAGGDAATKSSTCSIWTGTDNPTTFSQTYDGTTSEYKEGYFPESFYSGDTELRNLSIDGDKKATTTFMCVPREFKSTDSDASKVLLTVTYHDNTIDDDRTIEVNLSEKLNGVKWKAGQLYTYTLNVKTLTVDVESNYVESDPLQINNVVITNTGNMDGYIRATITANWVVNVDGNEIIVREDSYNMGEFTGLPGEGWLSGEDGFYYYKYGVQGGKHTNVPLFLTYKPGEAPTKCNDVPFDVPFGTFASFGDGAYRKLFITAQIVPFDTAKSVVNEAWDPSILDQLTDVETPNN